MINEQQFNEKYGDIEFIIKQLVVGKKFEEIGKLIASVGREGFSYVDSEEFFDSSSETMKLFNFINKVFRKLTNIVETSLFVNEIKIVVEHYLIEDNINRAEFKAGRTEEIDYEVRVFQ